MTMFATISDSGGILVAIYICAVLAAIFLVLQRQRKDTNDKQ